MSGDAIQLLLADGTQIQARGDASGNLLVSSGGSGTAAGADSVTLVKTAVTMTGASTTVVAALTTRSIVMISSAASNAAAAIDITGGTAALTAGVPLAGGATLTVTGKACQSAMTGIGTNTQLLTVYAG
jgi:hypothetical protein